MGVVGAGSLHTVTEVALAVCGKEPRSLQPRGYRERRVAWAGISLRCLACFVPSSPHSGLRRRNAFGSVLQMGKLITEV